MRNRLLKSDLLEICNSRKEKTNGIGYNKISNVFMLCFSWNCCWKTIGDVESCVVSGCPNSNINGEYKFLPNGGDGNDVQFGNNNDMKIYFHEGLNQWRVGSYNLSRFGTDFYFYYPSDKRYYELKVDSKVTIKAGKGFLFDFIFFSSGKNCFGKICVRCRNFVLNLFCVKIFFFGKICCVKTSNLFLCRNIF